MSEVVKVYKLGHDDCVIVVRNDDDPSWVTSYVRDCAGLGIGRTADESAMRLADQLELTAKLIREAVAKDLGTPIAGYTR